METYNEATGAYSPLGGSIMTDDNGIAEFYVSWKGPWVQAQHYEEMIIKVAGSEGAEQKVVVTRSAYWANLNNIGRALLWGSEAVDDSSSGFAKLAGWVADSIPFASDLRTLGMEVYKAASGCDKVSGMNITFAVLGLAADIFTFGTGGAAVKAGKIALKKGAVSVFKNTLKISAKHVLKVGVAGVMIDKTISYATTAMQGGDDLPATHWVNDLKSYTETVIMPALDKVDQGIQSAVDSLNETFTSVGRVIDVMEIHSEYGIDLLDTEESN